MVISFLQAVTFTILNAQLKEFYDGPAAKSSFAFGAYVELGMTCLVMYVLVKQIPNLVSSFLSGGEGGLGGGSALGQAATVATAASGGAKTVATKGMDLAGQYMAASSSNKAIGGSRGVMSTLATMGKGMTVGMTAAAIKPFTEGIMKQMDANTGGISSIANAKKEAGDKWDSMGKFGKLMSAVDQSTRQTKDSNKETAL